MADVTPNDLGESRFGAIPIEVTIRVGTARPLISELLAIEQAFLSGCGYTLPINGRNPKPQDPMNKDLQFKGLEAVISKLCELDGIRDIMDCEELFSYQPRVAALA